VPFKALNELEFIKLLKFNLKLDSDYTFLLQDASYEQCIYLMLGPQTGIHLRDT